VLWELLLGAQEKSDYRIAQTSAARMSSRSLPSDDGLMGLLAGGYGGGLFAVLWWSCGNDLVMASLFRSGWVWVIIMFNLRKLTNGPKLPTQRILPAEAAPWAKA